jgi:hypothetical protein
MTTTKSLDLSGSNFEKIKDEVLNLITGQDRKGDFDYVALIKRVTVILIAVYGITRVTILRKLAFSIATTLFTRWMAEKATEVAMGEPKKPRLRVVGGK